MYGINEANDEILERTRYEEDPVYLPRHGINLKPEILDISSFFDFDHLILRHFYDTKAGL